MSMPGWYPDPAGVAGRYRYWDGTSWSNETTTTPGQSVPSGPTGPGGPARPGNRGGGGRRNWTWLIVAVVGVAVIAVVIWLLTGGGGGGFTPVPEDTNSSTPTVSGWDETSTPTPPPTTQASLTACPTTAVSNETKQSDDGRLHGGGISVQEIDGWVNDDMYLQWVSDFHTQVDQVRTGWISNIGVGQLNAEDGFTDPQTSAQQSMECYASSGYYLNFTNRIDLVSESTTVSGYPAWHMRSEVHVSSIDMPEIDGDVVDIYVVDLGDPERMGIFVSSVTIGDTTRQALVDESISTLSVG
ncbi:hypothetical protein GCM10009785_17960 [Brooklawnia cerclae]|uniref:DUF2510 domain-containing protein n=1 Tax=Brooklawnia cerclae TaxID=349934 RepID=A0ABX0SGW2_9ACTN|nr:DUF2510 domain-containing protein [Brooklawnia cerclae]NIH57633.1 hypothetical protein [Brooklawnia cerclae]